MEQSELHSLLHPYFDGELDLSDSLAFEEHLNHCTDCSQVLEEQRKLRAVLEQSSLRYIAPKELNRAVQSSLKRNSRSRKVIIHWNWRIYGIAASITIVLLGLWIVIPKNPSNLQAEVTNEIISSHVRSLMVSHLFDVASSDQHTVKPWFAGKLDFSPIVKDLSLQGFQLIGGRLDYIEGKPVAALVYQYRKHIINIFEWNIPPNSFERLSSEHSRGFNLIADQLGEIRLWLISDLNAEELNHLADLLK
jgi:anti-sigma factor RsiW